MMDGGIDGRLIDRQGCDRQIERNREIERQMEMYAFYTAIKGKILISVKEQM